MEIRKLNHRVGWLVADYLNDTPCAVTPELMAELLPEAADAATEERVYGALLCGFWGLDPDASAEDRIIEEGYLRPGLRRLDAAVYRENPYYQTVRIPERTVGQWQLTHQSYAPYELFLRDDLILTEDLRQIPALGYFAEDFSYPSVLQDGREWMSIKPSEIESSQAAIDAAFGHVVTFGLGLGYFAFMAARKQEVASVTVVERDPSVIRLFREQLLPQFPHRDKITVIQADAFDYLEQDMISDATDFVFMDIWHDIADGLDLYVRARQYESRFPATRFTYWIDRSLKCALVDALENRLQ
jgi:CheY-like chemotaxis protein